MKTSDGLDGAVRRVVSRFARVEPPCSGDAHLYRDLGIASMQALQLLLALESELGVHLDDQRFIASTTLEDLTRLVGGSA